ncbi:MAG: PEP-CTERM sorting domain-containing protein [Phycisphaerales bacterium]
MAPARLAGILSASATICMVGSASAGFFAGGDGPYGNIDQMMVGDGYFDFSTGGGFDFVDIVSVSDPPLGTVVDLFVDIPGVETTGALLEWTASDGATATFNSATLLELYSGLPAGFDGAFAGQRLTFTTSVAVELNISSLLSTQGNGVGFFYNYQPGNYEPVLFFGDFDYSITLEAGTSTIAWGVLGALDEAGNPATAEMLSTVSLTLVPAPGSIALLGVAGLLGARRRRTV